MQFAKDVQGFGAEGIGLIRTEHMFFKEQRIFTIRKMITAPTREKRIEALIELLPMQIEDFTGIYEVMDGHEVTIRYLDPPLHEFLPHKQTEIKELAKSLNMSYEDLVKEIDSLKEVNPMMGHRGCRLAVTYPEIAAMQTEAVIMAALKVREKGINVEPEIMIPLVGDENELKFVKKIVEDTIGKILKKYNTTISYHIGTMIEVPRAALLSSEIAKYAEFYSFGTNDLTQMTYGFSRDDAGKFLTDYYDKKIFDEDPFAVLDQRGVGKLMQMAIKDAKLVNPNISFGICGEHGGNPKSVEFCHNIGLTYVSCSPYRVPVARLAAAQAKLNENK
jgi:pyruvate,orthophosphate dikinase